MSGDSGELAENDDINPYWINLVQSYNRCWLRALSFFWPSCNQPSSNVRDRLGHKINASQDSSMYVELWQSIELRMHIDTVYWEWPRAQGIIDPNESERRQERERESGRETQQALHSSYYILILSWLAASVTWITILLFQLSTCRQLSDKVTRFDQLAVHQYSWCDYSIDGAVAIVFAL